MKKIAFQGHGNYLNKKNQHFMKLHTRISKIREI